LNGIAKFSLWVGGFKAWNTWRDKKEDIVPFKWKHVDEQQSNNENQERVTEDSIDNKHASSKDDINDELFVSGKTKTTQIGYENSNNQKVLGSRNIGVNNNKNVSYKMVCGHCGELYGAKTSEIHRRKCPYCQEGKPSVSW
jgi:hypothetical protein